MALAAAALLVAPAEAQRGGIALPQNLGELVDRSETIVRGRVLSARAEPHPEFRNLHTVVITLQVQETLKGQAADTFTFRQYIWDIRDRTDAAGYKKAGELLLFLTQPSAVGLSSPVGLGQGRFRILRDPQGNEYAVNEVRNAGLFNELDTQLRGKGVQVRPELAARLQPHQQGPVRLEDLREIVRQLVGGQ